MKNNNIKLKSNKFKHGFSFLEMIIAMAIFSIIALAAVAAFASIMGTSKKTREVQKNMEAAGTAMEMMAKNIRMGSNFSNSELLISFYNTSQGKCIKYEFDDVLHKLTTCEAAVLDPDECLSASACGSAPTIIDLVTNVTGKFSVVPSSDTPPVAGKATIEMIIGGKNLQTTVSFMDYK